jgi:hypothetical protein
MRYMCYVCHMHHSCTRCAIQETRYTDTLGEGTNTKFRLKKVNAEKTTWESHMEQHAWIWQYVDQLPVFLYYMLHCFTKEIQNANLIQSLV